MQYLVLDLAGEPRAQALVDRVGQQQVARVRERRGIEAPLRERRIAHRDQRIAMRRARPQRIETRIGAIGPVGAEPRRVAPAPRIAQPRACIEHGARERREGARQASRDVARMAQYARMPHDLAELRVADALEHRRGFRVRKAVEHVVASHARIGQCRLQHQRGSERAVLGGHREVDQHAGFDFAAATQHAPRPRGRRADERGVRQVTQQAQQRFAVGARGVEPVVLRLHARVAAEVAAPDREHALAVARDLARFDRVDRRGCGLGHQCRSSSATSPTSTGRACR